MTITVRLLTAEEIGKELGLSRARICYLANIGTIPAVKIGRRWMFEKEEVVSFLKREMEDNVRKKNTDSSSYGEGN